jgi:multiple sugar transport system substrate-binding protein
MADFDAEAARTAFRNGRAALLIDRAERAASWTDPKQPAAVGVAALPGSERVFDPDRQDWQTVQPPNRPAFLPSGGGWLVGLARSTQGRQREAALDYLKYLAGPETSARLASKLDFPLLPTRSDQLGRGLPNPQAAPGVDGRSWGRAVAETLGAARIAPPLRIPESSGYLADLAAARRRAVRGAATPQQALSDAEVAWNERTERLGRQRQLWYYRQSLNRATTTSQPPRRP